MFELLGLYFLILIIIIVLHFVFYILLFLSFFIVSYIALEKLMPKWLLILISVFVSIIGLTILFLTGLLYKTIFLLKILFLIIPLIIFFFVFKKNHKKKILFIFAMLFIISVITGIIIIKSSPQNFLCNDSPDKELCYVRNAIKSNDINFCDNVKNIFNKKICVGIVNRDFSICNNVTFSDAPEFSDPRSSCYIDLAKGLKNVAICDNIINENYKNTCLDSWNSTKDPALNYR